MTLMVNPDPRRAASHRHMADHLTAPFDAGVQGTPLAIGSNGDLAVTQATRHPLLALAPARALEGTPWTVELHPPDSSGVIVLRFAPYTEEEAYLPALAPAVDANGEAGAFTVNLKLRIGGTAVAQSSVGQELRAQLLEGVSAKTIFLLGGEKARIRRQAREIAAMRLPERARDDALDRLGGEVAVPRFADRLEHQNGALVSTIKREPDDDYRRRIALFRRSFLRSPAEIRRLLNGPGADADPNRGPIGELAEKVSQGRAAYQHRFAVDERGDELAVAIHLVAGGDPAYRDNFLEFVRAVHLIWPRQTQQANSVHDARYLPRGKPPREERHDREQRLRKELRKLLDFSNLEPGPEPALAPGLAEALIRAARCINALGGPRPWSVFRCQRGDRGSRYELGLGADLKRLTGAELTAMQTTHAQLKAQDPEFRQIADPDPGDPRVKGEIQGLLKSMNPATAAADPDGRWLFEPCGLRTVHRLPSQTGAPWPVSYLSHFPVHGLTIEERTPKPAVPVDGWTSLATGNVGWGDFDELFSYERGAHAGQLWTTTGDGSLVAQPRDTSWKGTITQVVTGAFWGNFSQTVLVYDPNAQVLSAHDLVGDRISAQPSILAQNVGANWTHVVPLSVPGGFEGPTSRVVLYDKRSGDLSLYGVDILHTGDLSFREQKRLNGWRPGWTHLAGVDDALGEGALFAYDRRREEGAFYGQTGDGGLGLRSPRLRELGRWTHVVAGRFGNHDGEGLLFFDRPSGLAELRDSRFNVLARHTKWPTTTSEIIPGYFSGGHNSDVLVYERLTGEATIWKTSVKGEVSLLRSANTFPKSPASEVVARYHAPGDPGSHVTLDAGLANALFRWTALGEPPWTVLSRNTAEQAWQQATARPANDPALKAFANAGLPAVADPQPLVPKLKAIQPDLVDTIRLDPAQSQAVAANAAGAADILKGIVGLLTDERLTSALPLVTAANEVVILVGALPLPVAGTNLYEAPSAGFRWYVVPIQGAPGSVRASGAKTEYAAAEPGLCALVAVGYARRDGTEPYEFRVDLPPGALLTVEQYELLMNLLGHAYPAGVRVNTWSIRQRHVDVKGNGTASPLDPTISRTYRAFRRPRQRGLSSVTLEDES